MAEIPSFVTPCEVPSFIKPCDDVTDPDRLSSAMYPETMQMFQAEINHAKERMVCGFAIQSANPDYVRYALKARNGKLNKNYGPIIKWSDFKRNCTATEWFNIIEETYDYLHEISGPNAHCSYFYESHATHLISCLDIGETVNATKENPKIRIVRIRDEEEPDLYLFSPYKIWFENETKVLQLILANEEDKNEIPEPNSEAVTKDIDNIKRIMAWTTKNLEELSKNDERMSTEEMNDFLMAAEIARRSSEENSKLPQASIYTPAQIVKCFDIKLFLNQSCTKEVPLIYIDDAMVVKMLN